MNNSPVREVGNMFSLLNRAVHHGEVRESGTKVVITTSADQWSYAVGFPKSPNVVGSKHLVLVDVLVETGRVGVGALAKDGNTFLFEREVGADEGPVTVEIPARDVAGCEVLMIRNVQGDGQASRVLVEAIRVYEGADGMSNRAPAASGGKDCYADIMRLADSAAAVVDIGANIGDTVEKFHDIFSNAIIHAIEPTPALLLRLNERFRGQAAVRIHGLAISDQNGSVRFHSNKNHVTNSLLPWAPAAEKFVEGSLDLESTIEVPSRTLEAFCDEQKIGEIDLLKIDVQGAEKLVLGGARNLFASGRIKLVLLEASFVPIYANQTEFGDILNFMQSNGYALFNLYDLRYTDDGQIKWGDALFFRPS